MGVWIPNNRPLCQEIEIPLAVEWTHWKNGWHIGIPGTRSQIYPRSIHLF